MNIESLILKKNNKLLYLKSFFNKENFMILFFAFVIVGIEGLIRFFFKDNIYLKNSFIDVFVFGGYYLIYAFYSKKEKRLQISFSILVVLLMMLILENIFNGFIYNRELQYFNSYGNVNLLILLFYIIPIIIVNLEKLKNINLKILTMFSQQIFRGILAGGFFIINYIAYQNLIGFKIYITGNIKVIIGIVIMSVFYSVGEELFFRKLLLEDLIKNGINYRLAYFLTSILFTLKVFLVPELTTDMIYRLIPASLLLFGLSIAFSHIYIKYNKSIVINVLIRSSIFSVYLLTYF
ncbi:CPBP family glutamic-type intramembrane protease [Haliovirga abyssi]|uniref:CAAX prenyl protease 2/Lysostaphin resistance protein A-like domain-containing protein n=1 Tax=Haliovirga abyssi TaxID=2996794 RepID=A0AAU9DG70_9FUSO|nr:CPBP family glutamic-type intramembrane protease [Haliovirga abyssi]BDU51467.1 hypothetical protein HLVA_20360 [Haliovirga abyssi]